MSTEGVAAVDRALTLLSVFTDADASLTLTELSKRAGFYKSTTLRLAESLTRFGYMRRGEDGAYRIGPTPLLLGALYQQQFRTADVVPPVLRRLVAEVHEGASYYVREGDERVCLHRVDAARSIRDSVHEGSRLPLALGASGHILLAFGEGGSDTRYEAIRRQLVAVSLGERDPEIAAIAAPVFAAGQRLAGALSVSGPRYRFEDRAFEPMVPVLQQCAAELTHTLGGHWPGL